MESGAPLTFSGSRDPLEGTNVEKLLEGKPGNLRFNHGAERQNGFDQARRPLDLIFSA